MQRKLYFLLFISFLCLIHSCSSVKVLDAWKSDSVSNVKDNSFLVIARTSNQQARVAFENEIVDQMSAQGYKATASFSKFGAMKPDEKPSEDQNNKIVQLIKNEGFDGVVLTVVKDLQEETRVERIGGYYEGGNYWGYYPRYYGRFGGYYYHPTAYSTLGNYVPETITTRTSKNYVLETTVYDLNKDGDNQLVAVVTSKIEDPQNAFKTAEEYVKKVSESLK